MGPGEGVAVGRASVVEREGTDVGDGAPVAAGAHDIRSARTTPARTVLGLTRALQTTRALGSRGYGRPSTLSGIFGNSDFSYSTAWNVPRPCVMARSPRST